MPTDKIVDVRTMLPREKHPSIFSAFNELKMGEKFQLVNDHDPIPLYYQFSAQYPNQFGWAYQEKGPEVWRVDISRIDQ